MVSENDAGKTNADITKEQAALQYEVLKTQLDDAVVKAKLARDQASDVLDFSTKNKDVQLRLLANAISSAKVAYNDAARNVAKLSATAPLDGQVAAVLVDEGQEVSIGTPLVTFIGNAKNQIRIVVDETQHNALSVGDQVSIHYGSDVYSGSIQSLGAVADSTLGYPVIVSVPDDVVVVGGVVVVDLVFQTSLPLVPLDVIRPRGHDRAMVSFWDGSSVIMQEVVTGKTRGDMIEVSLDSIPDDYMIITTDLGRYNPQKHTIKIVDNKE